MNTPQYSEQNEPKRVEERASLVARREADLSQCEELRAYQGNVALLATTFPGLTEHIANDRYCRALIKPAFEVEDRFDSLIAAIGRAIEAHETCARRDAELIAAVDARHDEERAAEVRELLALESADRRGAETLLRQLQRAGVKFTQKAG